MLTKQQKKESIQKSVEGIKASKSLVFADFSGVNVSDLEIFKKSLRESGAQFKVVKKRLLNIALKQAGVDVDTMQFDGPTGVVFAPEELITVASTVHKFGKSVKDKTEFKVLGAYDAKESSFLDAEKFTVIAKLPSKEVLLAQVVGAMAGTIRAFMYIVDQLSKREQGVEAQTNVEDTPSEQKKD